MCLVVLAWQAHPDYRLVLAANRDEFHRRPSAPMQWWDDATDVLGGRDLEAGGSWLAVARRGRFATVTNYRERQQAQDGWFSRGELVTRFATGTERAADYAKGITGASYAGFSLLTCDGDELWYVSNRGDPPVSLPPGVYGLSNASLDTPWPKVVQSRDALRALIESDDMSESAVAGILSDSRPPPVARTDTGVLPADSERALGAAFIVGDEYGTRCTTTLRWRRDGEVAVSERRFGPGGKRLDESRYRFAIVPPQPAA